MRFCQYFGKKRLNILAFFRFFKTFCNKNSHPAITCLELTIETLEQVVKYVSS